MRGYPKIQCTRMELLTQHAAMYLTTCPESIDSFLLKVSPCMKNEALWIKKLVWHKVIWKMGSVLRQITLGWLHILCMDRPLICKDH